MQLTLQKEIVFKLKQKQWGNPWVYQTENVSFVGMALVNAYYTRFPPKGCHFVPNSPWTLHTRTVPEMAHKVPGSLWHYYVQSCDFT